MSARGYTSAGVTFRQCRDCCGAGEMTFTHPSRDPDLDEYWRCASCGGTGYIRETRIDPLEALQSERLSLIRVGHPGRPLDDLLAPYARRHYREARDLAMARVSLPAYVAPRAALEFAA